MQGFAAGCHPHPSPAQGEAPAVPAGAPSPLPAEAAAGLRHLRHPPGESAGVDEASALDSPLFVALCLSWVKECLTIIKGEVS